VTRRARAAGLAAAILFSAVQPAYAYLHLTLFLGGESVRLRWEEPRVRWFVSERSAPGVSSADFRAVIERALATWEDVPTASIAFQFGGFTQAAPFEDDTLSVFGFLHEPDQDRVLGATSFIVDTLTGELVESDIFFNTAFSWSAGTTADPARFDLQSVAVHEMGHFLGLGHSALGETEVLGGAGGGRRVISSGSVMFPIAFGRGNTADRELQPDDVAGISDLYPDGDFEDDTGVLRGRVVRNGRGVVGAHVTAFNPATGALVAGFVLSDRGDFQIAGLAPGAHVVRVEPLDDAEIDSFFAEEGDIDVDFAVTFYPRLAVAPRGGASERFDITVRPR
jgi:hypothetical protein